MVDDDELAADSRTRAGQIDGLLVAGVSDSKLELDSQFDVVEERAVAFDPGGFMEFVGESSPQGAHGSRGGAGHAFRRSLVIAIQHHANGSTVR